MNSYILSFSYLVEWMQHQFEYNPKIWHKSIPLKVLVFSLQLFQNKITSKDNLLKRGIISGDATLCVSGCEEYDLVNRLLFVAWCHDNNEQLDSEVL
jgi:hypothetical protein